MTPRSISLSGRPALRHLLEIIEMLALALIKRVVGLAGDSVEIHDGLVWINGTALDESYPYASTEGDPPDATDADPNEFAETVPDGDLFLMGDHRANSVDSRVFGSVPATAVVGRAWLRYWPFDVFTILPTPAYPKVAATKSLAPAAARTHSRLRIASAAIAK